MLKIILVLLAFKSVVFSQSKLDVYSKLENNQVRSEGLDIYDGYLWQSAGEGDGLIKRDLKTGEILEQTSLYSGYEEGIMWIGDKLLHVDYYTSNLFIGNIQDKKYVYRSVDLKKKMWGIAFDGTDLLFSEGRSNKIYFFDSKSYKEKAFIETEVEQLEDIVVDNDIIWATGNDISGRVYALDKNTGLTKKIFLLDPSEKCMRLDGITIDDGLLYVTGKGCMYIFTVKLNDLYSQL